MALAHYLGPGAMRYLPDQPERIRGAVEELDQEFVGAHAAITPLLAELTLSAGQLGNAGYPSLCAHSAAFKYAERIRRVVTSAVRFAPPVSAGFRYEEHAHPALIVEKWDGFIRTLPTFLTDLDNLPDTDVMCAEMVRECLKAAERRGSVELTEPNTHASSGKKGSGPQYVTYQQMAIFIKCSKRTLENWYRLGKLPGPAVSGKNGKAHKWIWSEVRPHLEKELDRPLTERFPDLTPP